MVTKLQILGKERFKEEICNDCRIRTTCDPIEQDMENCDENLELRDCR